MPLARQAATSTIGPGRWQNQAPRMSCSAPQHDMLDSDMRRAQVPAGAHPERLRLGHAPGRRELAEGRTAVSTARGGPPRPGARASSHSAVSRVSSATPRKTRRAARPLDAGPALGDHGVRGTSPVGSGVPSALGPQRTSSQDQMVLGLRCERDAGPVPCRVPAAAPMRVSSSFAFALANPAVNGGGAPPRAERSAGDSSAC